MSEARTPLDPQAEALAERMENAVVEAARDLKGYYMREISGQLAQIEERYEKRIAEVEAQLQGMNIKLVAIRNELHTSMKDQLLKIMAAVTGIIAFGIGAIMLSIHRWG